MSKFSNSIIIALILLLSFVFTNSNVLAQTDDTTVPTEETKPILFVLDTCPYCNALLKELDENELTDTVEIIEVSKEPAKSQFNSAISDCGVKTAVPTLYIEDRCFQGQYSARDRIFEANLIPIPKEANTPTVSETTTEVDSNSLSDDEIPTDDTENQDGVVSNNENDSSEEQSLENKIVNFNDSNNNYSWITFLAALLAPTVLIIISYLIIVKMKV